MNERDVVLDRVLITGAAGAIDDAFAWSRWRPS
jgi:hypothetical protein